MIILGLDPGLATLGYGVIRKEDRKKAEMLDYGIISTPKNENLAVRLCILEKGIKQIIHKISSFSLNFFTFIKHLFF